MCAVLSNFSILRPKNERSQKEGLEWLACAHAKAQNEQVGSSFHQEIHERLIKLGMGPDKIHNRGAEYDDCLHENWEEMELFNQGFQKKSEFFDRAATSLFERFYPEGVPLPSHLIHVTCTGYVDPSPAKKLVAKRGAGKTTTVTHAYHMGCYAAFPAIRIALGFDEPTDIVHTELCTLHMNPFLHDTEQLVVQTLFADGYIKYSVGRQGAGLKVLALHEEIIPDSSDVMTWVCHDWGLKMTLAKEIPVMIARALPHFLKTLSDKAEISLDKALFAIHPGGPKIIDQVAKILRLEPFQYAHSAEILKIYGNMSSATLPHVWDKMLQDETVRSGTPIVSFAFGPGLCLSGGIFQCVR